VVPELGQLKMVNHTKEISSKGLRFLTLVKRLNKELHKADEFRSVFMAIKIKICLKFILNKAIQFRTEFFGSVEKRMSLF
jgi:hypothetical protein